MPFSMTLEERPSFTLAATIQAAKDFNVKFLPEIAPRLETYARQNIETGKYPSSWDSTSRDASYPPLASSTVKDKMRMGATYTKANKRFGALINSIKGSYSGNTVTIIADATHWAGQRRALRAMPFSLIGGAMYPMTGLVPFTSGSGMRQLVRGFVGKFGGRRALARADVLGWQKRLMGSTMRRKSSGGSTMGQSYAAAVNATRPFLAFHSGLITQRFYKYMNEAARA